MSGHGKYTSASVTMSFLSKLIRSGSPTIHGPGAVDLVSAAHFAIGTRGTLPAVFRPGHLKSVETCLTRNGMRKLMTRASSARPSGGNNR